MCCRAELGTLKAGKERMLQKSFTKANSGKKNKVRTYGLRKSYSKQWCQIKFLVFSCFFVKYIIFARALWTFRRTGKVLRWICQARIWSSFRQAIVQVRNNFLSRDILGTKPLKTANLLCPVFTTFFVANFHRKKRVRISPTIMRNY